MRVEQLGAGEPELAIVGGIHGDEPCGRRAVERLLADDPDVDRPVKLVVANEEALERNARYVEEDLNRAFPGDPDGTTHESRLAAELTRELRGCTVFSLHSTRSYAAPFALVDELGATARSICPSLTVEAVVETAEFSVGRLIAVQDVVDVVEVECGLQGSEGAARNAVSLCYEFLAATGALPRDGEPALGHAVPVFRLTRQIPKPVGGGPFRVFARNFERVAAGEAFAAAADEEFVAEESFYPVLLSPDGYEDVFGYAAELCGRLDDHPVEAEHAPGRL
ncbi:MAG: succinylglutamate desuccinylase/aspartoacylase family protein [Haloarculaceae archaeon]